ncbi:related to Inositol polyphosphate multikinase [Saccharomycodes ludwigii]|uniref:Kinase n=1 Tax=Saccharomycodes ludwigii TaxID=36035 RepID=A0A376B5P6_9ASCO|nr:related to Inositol polyphosphate multikinase [Saccharomycodes ludwigii]
MENLHKFEHQAAGHEGTLTDEDEYLFFKPVLKQEIDFYSNLNNQLAGSVDDNELSLKDWIPKYIGLLTENDTTGLKKENINYVVLENLLRGFRKPNIMDIKLGKILYDEQTVTLGKKERLIKVSNDTTSGSLGFRICGMRVYNYSTELDHSYMELDEDTNYITINKFYGRSRTIDNIDEAIDLFFSMSNLDEKIKHKLAANFLSRLQLLYNTLLDSEVRMYSSSLLFIYETDQSRWEFLDYQDDIIPDDIEDEILDEDETTYCKTLSRLNLIDFAHSRFTPGEGPDENVLVGIENLIRIFEKEKNCNK